MMKTMLLFAAAILTAGCSTAPAPATEKPAAVGSIVRLDPSFDALVPKNAQIEKLAGGFAFTEGPVWRPSGVLWFSDVVGNPRQVASDCQRPDAAQRDRVVTG
jgi:gluconolactonase